ncbi:MAG: hypothetical protein ACREJD_02705 [Phycisphaerales bacterium]
MGKSVYQAVRFGAVFRLSSRATLENSPICGPLFQGWIPNGESDAIALVSSGLSQTVEVWFERRFKPGIQPLEYDFNHREPVADNVVAQSNPIDAGYLFSACNVNDVPESVANRLLENRTSFSDPDPASGEVESFGKSLYKTMFPPIRVFCERMILELGQWWLTTPHAWDSRHESLGNYFQHHSVTCQFADGKTGFFLPTAPTTRPEVSFRFVGGYMSKHDWTVLARTCSDSRTYSSALRILVDAERCLIEDFPLMGLIQAITALEMAVSEFASSCYPNHEKGHEQMSAWKNSRSESLGPRVAALFARSPESAQDVDGTLKAISLRNKIVHNGYRPTDPDAVRSPAEAAISLCRYLIGAENFKLCVPGHRVFLDGANSAWD